MALDGISSPFLATFDCVGAYGGTVAKEDVMGTVRRSQVQEPHQVFRAVFEDWQSRTDALSALPNAPVVADDSRRGRGAWRRLRSLLGRTAGDHRSVAPGKAHEEGPSGVVPAAPPLPS
jgi:hypothetical protein